MGVGLQAEEKNEGTKGRHGIDRCHRELYKPTYNTSDSEIFHFLTVHIV